MTIPIADRFWTKVNKSGPILREELGPCWVWTSTINHSGYGEIKEAGLRSCVTAHRFSFEQFHGKPAKNCVLHRCDNRACVNPSHLFEGTRADNVRDMCAKGRGRKRALKGSENPCSKLKEGDVLKIVSLCKSGSKQKHVAKQFGVGAATIHKILKGMRWRHVTGISV